VLSRLRLLRGMILMDLEKWELRLKNAQELNKKIMVKNIRFFIWLLINSVFFLLISVGFMKAYDLLGFERTIILLITMVFLSQVREQYNRA
jgi:hypothetical protein